MCFAVIFKEEQKKTGMLCGTPVFMMFYIVAIYFLFVSPRVITARLNRGSL